MPLMSLPPELLLEIVHLTCNTSPRSFESLRLSCKTLCEAGREFLPRHNQLRWRYRYFGYGHDIPGCLQLLEEISKDPVIACHIEEANLLYDDTRRPLRLSFDQPLDTTDYFATVHSSPLIQRLLQASSILRQAGVDPATCFHDVCGNTNDGIKAVLLATIILISWLPNLIQLTLPRCWSSFPVLELDSTEPDGTELLWKLMDAIASSAGPSSTENRTLGRLQRLQFPHIPASYPVHDAYLRPAALQCIFPFFLLPSMSEVYASNCVATTAVALPGKPFIWRRPSNLERLELSACDLTAPELERLLRHCPRLRSFRFSYGYAYRPEGIGWDAHAIVTAIEKHCADHLTELSITIDRVEGHVKAGLRSMKSFTKLEHLELDARLFFGPEVVADLVPMSPSTYRNHAYQVRWNGSALPNLQQILPPSTKTLRLIAGSSREDILIVKALFKGLDLRPCEVLPHLETVRVSRVELWESGQLVFSRSLAAAWQSVGDVVEAAGGTYEELEDAEGAPSDGNDAYR